MKGLYVGFFLLLLSYLSFFISTTPVTRLLLGASFYLGVIFICEWLTLRLSNKSLVQEICRSWQNIFVFIIIVTVGGILLDGGAKFLGKLWIYPDWSPTFYAFIFIPGFAAYWLVIAESYLGVKVILDWFIRGKKLVTNSYKFERALYTSIGLGGILLCGTALFLLATDFKNQELPLFIPANVHSSTQSFQVAFTEILTLFLGVWFILEWIEYSRKRSSLLKDIVHQYYTPLAAIIISSGITAVFMEAQNIPAQLWTYTNWPLKELDLFGLPLVALLVWPLHYVLFLSLFRAFSDKESRAIWQGDTIK